MDANVHEMKNGQEQLKEKMKADHEEITAEKR
jgi:hypothetical protein